MREQIDREESAADRGRGFAAELIDLGGDHHLGGDAVARRVRDPVVGAAVDGADSLVPHDARPDVALGLVDVLLNVKDAVLIGAERLFVLEHRFGRVAVVDLRQQPAPRADHRLQHDRVSHRLDRLQRRLAGEGDHRLRHRQAGASEGRGRQDLVAADARHPRPVHRQHPGRVQERQRVERAPVVDRPVQDDIRGVRKGAADRELDEVLVEALEGDGAPARRSEHRLLFDADAGAKDADHRWLRNHTGFRILMRLHPLRRLNNMLALKSKLLEQIDATPVKTAKKVALAYSGGLDSSLCAVLAKEKYQVEELFAITVDVGQGQDEMDAAIQKAKVLGITPIVIDAKQEFADLWLTKAIQANSNYEGYPVSTSMTRQLIASKIALLALKLGCGAIMEGSSGKGNDQYRMHNVFKLFAPQLDVLVPVRDFDLTRGEEEELSKELGIPITEVMQGGDDKTLWCRSLASGAVGLNQPIPDHAWLWLKPPSKQNSTPTQVSVTFDHGVPVALDGKEMSLPEIVSKLNVIAGSHGIGKIDIFEDGIMGLKSRELYEAPAAAVLLQLHQQLGQFTLTKEELDFKAGVDQKWAYLVYHGAWFSPLKEALDAFIATTQSNVSGIVTANLFHGTIDLELRQSNHSLFFPEIRGLQSRSFNQQLCGPAAQIGGLPWEVLAKRNAKVAN